VVAATRPTGLIDTDILIDAARAFADGVNFLAAQRAANGIAISIVSAMEMVAGCPNPQSVARVQTFLAAVRIVPISETASIQALHWMEQFSPGYGLTIPDALIAATAVEQQLPLYTRNTRHFQMLPGLQLIRPY
jgi:predicted nucleic acid-binding protein